MRFHWVDLFAGAASVGTLCLQSGDAQQKSVSKQKSATVDGDWPLYRSDFAGTRYSPLPRITVQMRAPLLTLARCTLAGQTLAIVHAFSSRQDAS